MRALLIVFAAVASLGTDQEARKRENIPEKSYSMSQLRVYDEDKSHRQLSCRFDLALTKKSKSYQHETFIHTRYQNKFA
jgi:hypothetical protein